MHPPRKWINSDRISSHLLHTGFPASLLHLFLLHHHRFNFNFNFKPTINNNNNNNRPDDDTCPSASLIFNQVEAGRGRSNPTPSPMVFGACLSMIVAFTVVGTKRLAFGITISAFLLLVLEYVGSFSFSRLQFISCFLLPPNKPALGSGLYQNQSQEYPNISSNELFQTSDDDNSSGDDREVSQRNVMDEKEEVADAVAIEISGTKRGKSRGALLKSKIIRRLVPKRLRGSKYCRGSEGKFEDHSTSVKVKDKDTSVGNLTIRQVMSEVESEGEECEYLRFALGDKKLSGDLSLPSHHSLDQEADCVIFGSGHSNALVKKCDITNKWVASNIQIDARGKSGYVMLVVIVLAGLVGGRILSFLLAIGYCCIVRYACTLRRASAKPNFTSYVQI